MPWNMNDYPNSMKNLDSVTRKKAIDIGNALLTDGYPDERAIPIAISQAEKWAEESSPEERRSEKYGKAPRKSDTHEKNPNAKKLMDAAVSVTYQDNQWIIISAGAKRASDRFDKKTEAIERGQEIAKNKGSKLKIFKRDGTLQETRNYE
ncbi:hypothetical protein NRIC_29150 [Enterococcus florum]|uniref:DUF2188 domain-containing protein n=1 Tax=Enterococcus florum TaxID=2480627 RepID=A0A4P5PEG4_9ENTE|nr:DUF2188 domain-containing protein [Enterococcus florum]GCF95024.1 hypothetical protein NRIC_29150 [Enterococcus florum]